jgi:hypothetical protein
MLLKTNALERFARSSNGFSYQQRQPAQHARYDASFYQHVVPNGTDSAVIARNKMTKQPKRSGAQRFNPEKRRSGLIMDRTVKKTIFWIAWLRRTLRVSLLRVRNDEQNLKK